MHPTYVYNSDIYSVINACVVNAKRMVGPDQIYMNVFLVFKCTGCVRASVRACWHTTSLHVNMNH